MKACRKKSCFALIELIIVISIIAILIVIAIPKFANFMSSANSSAIDANIRHIIDLIKMNMSSNLKQPDNASVALVIQSLNINKSRVTYSGKVTSLGIVLKYSSSATRYSGRSGYNTEPVTEADLNDNTKMNDGTPVENAYFVFNLGEVQ